MKLDRNITNPKRGKYALVKLRRCEDLEDDRYVGEALHTLDLFSCLDYGDTPETDFFVIRLKDKFAAKALRAYAKAAEGGHALLDCC